MTLPTAARGQRRSPLVASPRRQAARVHDAPTLGVVQLGALAAAAVLALTSTGDVVVLAVALGVGAGAALPGLVVALAAVAATARWGTPDLGDLAGTQSVLGPAGLVGPRLAAASSWAAALAVVLAWPGPGPASSAALPEPDPSPEAPVLDRLREAATSPAHALGAVAVGGSAAALVWGPGLAGGWAGRVVATAVGAALALLLGDLRRHRPAGVTCGAAAAVLGVLAVLAAVASRPDRPAAGPDVPLGSAAVLVAIGAAAVAVAGVVLAARRTTGRATPPGVRLARWVVPAASLALLATAARLAGDLDPAIATPAPPSGGLAGAGTLLALAAVVAALTGPGLGAVAAAPGAVAATHALLAAPPGAATGAVVALAGALAVVAVTLVVSATADPWAPWGSPTRAATGRLLEPVRLRAALGVAAAGTVVLVPGLWSWAGVEGLDPWGEGVAVTLAVGAATAVLASLQLRGARGSAGPSGRYARSDPGGLPGRTRASTGAPASSR